MLTIEHLAQIDALLAAIDTPGLRKVCAWCGSPLPGSDPLGEKVSHGVCEPLCGPARAMGWAEELSAVGTGVENGKPAQDHSSGQSCCVGTAGNSGDGGRKTRRVAPAGSGGLGLSADATEAVQVSNPALPTNLLSVPVLAEPSHLSGEAQESTSARHGRETPAADNSLGGPAKAMGWTEPEEAA